MQKWKTASIIFLLALIVCFVNFNFTFGTTTRIDFFLDNVKNNMDKKDADELYDFWEERSKIFAVLVHHDILDKISRGIAKIKEALRLKDINYMNEEIEAVRSLVKVLKESDIINLRNIF